jgi:hypothetical protein
VIQRVNKENRDHFFSTLDRELVAKPPDRTFFSDSNWQFALLGGIGTKFNRLVVYYGSILHSALVFSEKSLTEDPLGGRLTVNTFFDFAAI